MSPEEKTLLHASYHFNRWLYKYTNFTAPSVDKNTIMYMRFSPTEKNDKYHCLFCKQISCDT